VGLPGDIKNVHMDSVLEKDIRLISVNAETEEGSRLDKQ